MRCYPCNEAGRSTEAVALCPHCLIGLCGNHRASLAAGSPGGTGVGCSHDLRRSDRIARSSAAA
ncbi:MAG TPA: DUF2180 family protein [Thermoanaerobaculia bacterium]|nr:DUF2180 family protein [Thermoanaerobaculia bacterium]